MAEIVPTMEEVTIEFENILPLALLSALNTYKYCMKDAHLVENKGCDQQKKYHAAQIACMKHIKEIFDAFDRLKGKKPDRVFDIPALLAEADRELER